MLSILPSRSARRRLVPLALLLLAFTALLVPPRAVSRLRIYFLSVARPLVACGAGERAARPGDGSSVDLHRRIKELEEENRALRDVLLAQRDRIDSLLSELARDREFREALKLERDPRFIRSARVLPAMIISRSTNWHAATLLINRGSKDGVTERSGLVVGGAAVGVVVEVGPRVSRFAYLTEPGVQIPARVLPAIAERGAAGRPSGGAAPSASAALQGLLGGEGGRAVLRYVPSQLGGPGGTRTVRPGDLIVTSGLEKSFPRGLLLGRVDSVEARAEEPFLEIRVKPAVSLAEMDAVRVLPRE